MTHFNPSSDVIAMLEPMIIPEGCDARLELDELVTTLVAKSSALTASMPQMITESLHRLMLNMNCYYSNLIEDHYTHPIDIDQAMAEKYSTVPQKRELQLEAKAHITVQREIDSGKYGTDYTDPVFIRSIHKRFYELLPKALHYISDPITGSEVAIVGGMYRDRGVRVGQHIAIDAISVEPFLNRFHYVYGSLPRTPCILNIAACHHRFVWIHPFLDGNGRVARLITHSMLNKALNTKGLWSLSRGLSRNVDEYKNKLAACDMKRQGDIDGRGNLSLKSLIDFTRFFLETCIDQVDYMQTLINPHNLRGRILSWVDEEIESGRLNGKTKRLLREISIQGKITRAEAHNYIDSPERTSRRIIAELKEKGILRDENPGEKLSPLVLNFNATLAPAWFPGLFPEVDYE